MAKLVGTCKCGLPISIEAEEFNYKCTCGITYSRYFDAKKEDYVVEIKDNKE